jgi:hypothetical protein
MRKGLDDVWRDRFRAAAVVLTIATRCCRKGHGDINTDMGDPEKVICSIIAGSLT